MPQLLIQFPSTVQEAEQERLLLPKVSHEASAPSPLPHTKFPSEGSFCFSPEENPSAALLVVTFFFGCLF